MVTTPLNRFEADWHDDIARITLVRQTSSRLPFGRAQREVVAFDDWVLARPAEASAAVARILQTLDDGEASRDGSPLVVVSPADAALHGDLIARLTDSEAQVLGLPPATRLALNLHSSGLIHRDGFRVDGSWTRAGGVPVRATVSGARLRHDGRDWRIPEPLYSTLACINGVNAAGDEAQRQAAIAMLKKTIGDDASARIEPDGVIERLRLAYASGFSLSLRPSPQGFDFDPVLFSRERLDAAEDGAAVDEEADSLLPPALASGFARRFRAGDGLKRTYLLDDGSLLFIDPQLSQVLGAVRKAQSGGPELRRAFAVAPERHIAEVLRESGEATSDARRLFIETQQFSDRVAGIDVWRKPVLPWIKPKPNSWLPERFGLRVGEPPNEQLVEIAPDQLQTVSAAAQAALNRNEATFAIGNVAVPATQATVSALAGLTELAEAAAGPASAETEPPAAVAGRYFLQIRENLEEVDYAPLAKVGSDVPASPAELPAVLTSSPKPHQIVGFRWLANCWHAGVPGAMLADDMGLGKTYQALAFLAWVRRLERHPHPVLIVAPTGLLANWRAEIDRHLAPEALGPLVRAYGSDLRKLREGPGRDIEKGTPSLDPAAWSHAGVVLTTYETMRDYHMSFARQHFSIILYDEAQKLKNPASQLTRAAKTLNARFQLALTGTPVENRLQDLWSIFDVVSPGLLGSSKAFEQRYPPNPEKLNALHELLTEPQERRPPALLRRMKEECLDSLPAKRVRAIPTAMPASQAQAYQRVIGRALVIKGTGHRGRMLEILHQLRSVSLHPFNPDDAGTDSTYFSDSARLATLFDLLREIAAKGEKVLIFCESLAMQALLAAEIRRRFELPSSVIRIHGGVIGDARQAAVDDFQARAPGFDAMILSPKAGGVGLTLTAANHVIHLSRWWNPAVEDQATDRAYRIGQKRDVTVYLPQAVHPDPAIGPTSFDLKLHDLMERKRTLSRGLLAPAEEEGDADALFDSVVADVVEVEVAETLEPAAGEAPPSFPHEVSEIAAIRAERPRATLFARERPNLAPAKPTPSAGPEQSWPRRIVYHSGAARDYRIFTGPVANDPIRELVIVDPYAAAGERARRWTVDFAKLLVGSGAGVEPVRLISFDAESISLDQPESNDLQYADMHARWDRVFGSEVGLQFVQQSRRGNRNLHDREIRATTRSGRSLIWDLGHGVDGVMGNRHRCVVVLTED